MIFVRGNIIDGDSEAGVRTPAPGR